MRLYPSPLFTRCAVCGESIDAGDLAGAIAAAGTQTTLPACLTCACIPDLVEVPIFQGVAQ